MYTVYKIINSINGKIYIGVHKTENPNDSYMGSGRGITSAIKKYGLENFSKEILFITENKDDAYKKEFELTENYTSSNMYNMRRGGIGGFTPEEAKKGGKSITHEQYKRMGKKSYELKLGAHALSSEELREAGKKGGLSNKGKPKSEEHKRKISEANKGKRFGGLPNDHGHSEETRKKMSETRKGRAMSEETRNRIRESMKKYWLTK